MDVGVLTIILFDISQRYEVLKELYVILQRIYFWLVALAESGYLLHQMICWLAGRRCCRRQHHCSFVNSHVRICMDERKALLYQELEILLKKKNCFFHFMSTISRVMMIYEALGTIVAKPISSKITRWQY